ncbi:tetratricopeptide repeat protein, partial [Sphingomonas bacterium]|uniref:tetratricopeptide repeat protein n=1 Tax=Sphingomonas bacterium TaxID=1895847 RepID=UPI001576F14D
APPAERAAFVRAAADAGIAEAQAVYGQMLLDGAGVAKDDRAAVGWFWKAANQGHAMAINMIGRCYDLGWGVPVDKARAAEWYRIAADRGLDWAMYNLGTLLALGHGVPEDRPAALALFRKAAHRTGNPKAINFLGSFHEDGWVVAPDRAEAARLYALAAEGGDFRGMFNHARMLIEAQRLDEAIGWIRRAREAGNERFRAQVYDWLRQRPERELREMA